MTMSTFLPDQAAAAASTREAFAALHAHTGRGAPRDGAAETPPAARAVIDFWREAGPALWFAKDAEFDRRFRDRFIALHERAAAGALENWAATADGALALLILLDQFPRNAFRGTPRMYATDGLARRIAAGAVAVGYERAVAAELRVFVYLPFAHSENLGDQDRSVELCRALGADILAHAEHHRGIVRRFGRFPHRNPILGRVMTAEEQRFLDEGGYAG
jgi:uncharacterized protein (DUF924 family)